jgi:hypothetical protein
MLELKRPMGTIPPLDLSTSSLQPPCMTLLSASSPSENPAGQYADDSQIQRKLCKAMDTFVYMTTLSVSAIMGLLKTHHQAARIPKSSSIVLLALLNR